MEEDGYIWGEASVTYPDMKGTAQLDEAMTKPTIEHVVGLDPEQWNVIGLDIGGGELAHNLHVIAIPNDGVTPREEHAERGEVRATDFLIHDVDPYDVLRQITHVFDLRLRSRGYENVDIRVVAHGDVPEQEWQDELPPNVG